jgi:hypothetical protein
MLGSTTTDMTAAAIAARAIVGRVIRRSSSRPPGGAACILFVDTAARRNRGCDPQSPKAGAAAAPCAVFALTFSFPRTPVTEEEFIAYCSVAQATASTFPVDVVAGVAGEVIAGITRNPGGTMRWNPAVTEPPVGEARARGTGMIERNDSGAPPVRHGAREPFPFAAPLAIVAGTRDRDP